MIYLIGGSPRGGKSILSSKLSRKLNIPYLSTDNLKLMLRPYFKGKDKDKMFPFDKVWDSLTLDEYFLKYSGKDMIKVDTQEGKTIWPGTKYLISHLISSKQDYIIEGVHLLPRFVKDFKDNKNVKIIFLTKVDEEKIYKGLFKNKSNRDWILDGAKDKNTICLAAKSMSAYGPYFIKETEKYNFKCINTEDNFQKQLNIALRFLS